MNYSLPLVRFGAAIALVLSAAVLCAKPSITQQPGAVVATSGTDATFSVAAAGSGALSYQWRRFGVPIAGATSSVLTLPAVKMANAGFYDVVVYDGSDSTTSTAGQLFVQPSAVADTYRLDTSFTPFFEREGGCVNAVAEASGGAIYAGGEFTTIAGLPQRYLARFDSTLAVDASYRPVLDGRVNAILSQADGRVVIGGNFSTVNGVSRNVIARLNSDGSLDESFDPVFRGGVIRAFVEQSDGKIIVAGSFGRVDGVACAGVVRLTTDGAVDGTFAAPSEIGSNVDALALQPDGKVLVGGGFSSATLGNRLTRLNSDGSDDSSFAIGSGADSWVEAIVCQPDGKIVVAGSFTTFAGASVGRIVRLESNGAIDPTFAPGSGFSSTVNALANLPDGRIGVGGNFNKINGTYQYGFAVLSALGARDTSFAVGANLPGAVNALTLVSGGRLLVGGAFTAERGVATSGLVAYSAAGTTVARSASRLSSEGSVYSAIPVRDNKWMVGGAFSYVNGVPRTCLVRLNSDGTVDPTFDAGTLLEYVVPSIVEQGDGKLLVASWKDYACHLLRLNPDGSRDSSFSDGTGFDQLPWRLALLPDGRIAAAGIFTTFGGTPSRGIALLGRDGSRDSTFAPGAGFDNTCFSLVVQPDGRLVVGGCFTHYNNVDADGIVRLNPDGALQASLELSEGPYDGVYAISQQPDGRTLFGGDFEAAGGNIHPNRARLSPDFSIDSTYGTDLTVNSTIGGLSALPDGRAWMLCGEYTANCYSYQMLGRLTATGSIDRDFRSFDLASCAWGGVGGIQQADDGRLLVIDASAVRGVIRQSGLVMLKPDVSPLPQILSTVGGGAVQIGESVTLAVTATGEGPLTYIWRHDGVVIDHADGSSLTVGAVDNASAGTYSVEVSNFYGWADASMSLSLVDAPRIVTQPADVSIDLGQSTSLSVVSTGNNPQTYQWYRGESGDTTAPVTSESGGTLLPINAPTAWSRYWVRVTMGNTHVDSRTALVRVNGGTMTLADWTLLPGTPANQRGALDTPAGDGVCNLLKFALGVAPMDSAAARLPRAVIVAGQGTDRHMALEFIRNPLARGITLSLSTSSDLSTWTEVPATLISLGASGDDEKVQLRENSPLGSANRRFARPIVRLTP